MLAKLPNMPKKVEKFSSSFCHKWEWGWAVENVSDCTASRLHLSISNGFLYLF